MSDETDAPETRPRTSRFREHTNTNNSIKPPPDELWKDIGIEQLIEQFNEENRAPPTNRKASGHSATPSTRPGILRGSSSTSSTGTPSVPGGRVASTSHPAPAASEGAFGRFQRAWASVFGGVLGKRKAGHNDAERDKEQQLLDDRKKAAEIAYHDAKDRGLLPTPKVFVRPSLAAKSHNCVVDAATPARPPRTPILYRSPSKKDLNKQKKLSKRVSDLEFKLASARKELQHVLHNDQLPPVPALPTILPPTPPITSQSDAGTPPPAPVPATEHQSIGKIVKKRKATTDDDSDYKPLPTDSDADMDTDMDTDRLASEPELEREPIRTIKRVKSSASKKNLKRHSSRLQKRQSRSSITAAKEDRPVTVVPDGLGVPPVPVLPESVVVAGKRARQQGDNAYGDPYGGLEHEMF